LTLGRLSGIVAVALVAGACSTSASPAAAPAGPAGATQTPLTATVSLTIYAAASLKAALAKVKTAYEIAHPGTTLAISTDSSSALEAKIEEGAPADVFLSADTTNPQKLVDNGLASGSVVPFAGNLLTVIVPAGNPAGIQRPEDLARSGIKVIAAGDTVPITKYASLLVANLARESGAPMDFAERYAANVVSKEDNVASVVAKIELGEGDAAIVYVTDARTSTRISVIPVPAFANVSATYGGVVVKASANQAAAEAFLGWLAGADGQAILTSLGFLRPT
jgi:molybdate transport system substrate-binding protein